MDHGRVAAAGATAMSGKVSSSDPGSAWFGAGERTASSSAGMGGHNTRLIAAVVAAFVSVLGIALFLHLYICHVRRRNRRRRAAEAAAAAALPTTSPKGGLDAAAITALPTAVYKGDKDAAAECAICLGAVEGGDTVRVLPACGHVFHVPCVDTWLTSSSSCPVCRAGVEPPPAGAAASCSCVLEKPQDALNLEAKEEAGSSAPVRAIIGASLMKMLSRERPLVRRPQVADAGELDFDLERQQPTQQQEQEQAANQN